jgi:hypothetical protein
MFQAVVTADRGTTESHASQCGSFRSSISIRGHCEYRKLRNPQSPFLV